MTVLLSRGQFFYGIIFGKKHYLKKTIIFVYPFFILKPKFMKIQLLLLSILIFIANVSFAIDAPTNVSPSNSATNQGVGLNLDWSTVSGNNGYIYQIDTVITFDSPLLLQGNSAINVSNVDVNNLFFGTRYYWRVATKSAVDTSVWSTTTYFTTAYQCSNTSPSNGVTNQNISLTIDWSAISGNSGYIYQIDTVSTFDSPLFYQGVASIDNSNADVNNLYFGTTYYWRAAAKSSVDTSDWSPTWSFATTDNVNNVSPSNGVTNQNVNLNLDWSAITGNSGYIYRIDTVNTFDSPLLQEGNASGGNSNADVSGLLFGTTYYWQAAAKSTVDTSQWSNVWSFTTRDYLSLVAPANVATNQDVYLQLDWSYIDGATGYEVEIDTSINFDSPLFDEFTTTNSYYYVSSLNYGTSYYWRVRAYHASDTSEWSVVWSFTTRSALSLVSPSNGATNQFVYLQLDWAGLSGTNTYQVVLDTVDTFDSELSWSEETSNSYFYFSDLYYGTQYYWKARACHVNDTSEWSSIYTFTTRELVSLTSPSDNATNQDVYLQLDWATFTGTAMYDWMLDSTANFDSGVHQSGSESNSYVYVSDLYYNTDYFWRVRGRNASDTSEWCVERRFTTVASISNTSPSNGSTNISVSPLLNYSSSTGSYGYLCEVDTSLNFNSSEYQLFESPSGTSQVNGSGLLYGTKYYWRAATRNAVDTSAWSSVWSFTTAYELTDAPVLLSPADLSTDISFPSAPVSWNSSAGAVTYQYQYSEDPSFNTGVHSYTTSLLSGTITGLYPYTTYYWRVRGANANGYSPWSNVWEFTTESADLTPPVLVSPSNNAINVDTDNVTIDWNSVFGANAYIYEITEDETFVSGVVTQQVSVTEKEVIGLAYGTQYFWRVKSTDGAVESDWSDVWNFTTEYDVLETPVLISPSNGSNGLDFASIMLDWAVVSGASFYTYEYSQDITFTTDVTTDMLSDTEIELIDLDANSTYYWRIKAGNGVIESPWSTVWSFTTEEQIVNYTLTITIDGYGLVFVNDVEYTEPVSVPAGTELSLFADFPLPWPFQQWTGDLTGSNNPETIVMDGDKHVTAEFIYVSIAEMETNENGISIYPNPASNLITFECKDQERISIFSSTGQVVFEMRLDSDFISHDISSYAPGLYFVKFISGDQIYYGRFLKE